MTSDGVVHVAVLVLRRVHGQLHFDVRLFSVRLFIGPSIYRSVYQSRSTVRSSGRVVCPFIRAVCRCLDVALITGVWMSLSSSSVASTVSCVSSLRLFIGTFIFRSVHLSVRLSEHKNIDFAQCFVRAGAKLSGHGASHGCVDDVLLVLRRVQVQLRFDVRLFNMYTCTHPCTREFMHGAEWVPIKSRHLGWCGAGRAPYRGRAVASNTRWGACLATNYFGVEV